MLHEKIMEFLKNSNIKEFTLPQKKAIPVILQRKNCLIIAPTGMGKTEAAMMPVFHLFLSEKREDGVKILYITPLRALNRDMLQRMSEWGRHLGIKIAVRHGDTSRGERRRQAVHPPDMLITTPETLQIMLSGKKLRSNLMHVRWVIVDEIHELASNERGAQLAVAMERLNEIAGDYQRIGLSATIGNPIEIAKFLGGGREVEIIDAMEEKKMKIDVVYENSMENAIKRAREEIKKHESTLFFVNTRDTAEIIASKMLKDGVEIHHGSLSKEARIDAEERFKRGEIKALICTSSLELGIDIGRADFILHYNSPHQVARMVQRIGRSGHKVGRVARGMVIASDEEEYAEACVIAEKAAKNDVENIRIRKNPLSVLANQIVAIANEYGSIEVERVYTIIRRAYPFSNLSKELFMDVVKQLSHSRVIWIDDKIKSRKTTRLYFMDNISMIPDEKSMNVVDISTNKRIGKLDECFVSTCDIGTRFIMKGRAWEIVEMDDIIKVSPSSNTSIIPDWVGEEIPVPFEIAQEVGRLRRFVAEGKIKDEIIYNEIEKQIEKGFAVPSDRVITLEREGTNVVITTHFGSKTNETFSKLIGALVSQRYGSVDVTSDAYRIYLNMPLSIALDVIKDIFYSISEETLDALLRIILKRSNSIKWELVKVARKFGVISKDADYRSISVKRFVAIFERTPVIEEAIDKTIWDRMDMEHAKKVIEKLKKGQIKLIMQPLSPMSKSREKKRSEIFTFGIDKKMLEAVKKRIEETMIRMECMNCGYKTITRVYRAPIKCPKCGSRMMAVVKRNMSKDRKMKSASLVAWHGKRAIEAMAAHGIGPDTAARILAAQKKGMDFYREILEAEIIYARTRRFWD
ncbi:MAG: DEAD/DEAH box helicase [Thermoplasmata archaeon]|nr:DEAD/DEAH box helicase [Thermoplasmata archaeon]